MTVLALCAITFAIADPPVDRAVNPAVTTPAPQADPSPARGTPQSARHTTVQTSPLRPKLELLDQGIEDRGGIEKSFRLMPLDLRVPSGFQQVYRVPGSDDLVMRGNGALFAVFPRSLYRRTVIGALPVAPADLHYSIGMPGGFTFPGGFLRDDVPAPDPRISTRIDTRVRRLPGESTADPSAPADASDVNEMPAISEATRARRARATAQPLVIETVEDLRLGPPALARE